MTEFSTEQEKFWSGEFGRQYIERNQDQAYFVANLAFFSKPLARTTKISSILELGANIGLNLQALHALLPSARIDAVEINEGAVKELQSHTWINAHHISILDFASKNRWDMVFTKGVLIHINPNRLGDVYKLLYTLSNRYILICEYYNPSPVEVSYRGHSRKLFKRDFAGEIMDMYEDLQLVDYGFVYHRDNNYPQDDLTWFLMEKR